MEYIMFIIIMICFRQIIVLVAHGVCVEYVIVHLVCSGG